MNLTLRVWRQKAAGETGSMVTYRVQDVSPDMSFLEVLDVLNERLTHEGEDPIAFDSDCREGICGAVRAGHQWSRARAAGTGHDL